MKRINNIHVEFRLTKSQFYQNQQTLVLSLSRLMLCKHGTNGIFFFFFFVAQNKKKKPATKRNISTVCIALWSNAGNIQELFIPIREFIFVKICIISKRNSKLTAPLCCWYVWHSKKNRKIEPKRNEMREKTLGILTS